MLKPSTRSAVEPFLAMDVMAAATELEAAGRHIVHMEVGQPGAPAPTPVLAAAAEALRNGRVGYTEALGVRALRERIARYYRETHGIDVPTSRVARARVAVRSALPPLSPNGDDSGELSLILFIGVPFRPGRDLARPPATLGCRRRCRTRVAAGRWARPRPGTGLSRLRGSCRRR